MCSGTGGVRGRGRGRLLGELRGVRVGGLWGDLGRGTQEEERRAM